MTEKNSGTAAEKLRHALSDALSAAGVLVSDRPTAAIREVPRHLFLPGVSLERAYADTPVNTKHDGTGASISAASQPTIVGTQLEQLGAELDETILEVGAGTGYNAALIGRIVGPRGRVVTIDVDEDIVDGARSGLRRAGVTNVEVVLGDGALGHVADAPYDRIIATVGAAGVPAAWMEQLAPGGRIVVPQRLRGDVSRSICYERADGGIWRSRGSAMCTFMPLRGIADDARRMVSLTADDAVVLTTNREQGIDGGALAGVLGSSRTEVWTGVSVRRSESMEWMDLWLACSMDTALSRMAATRGAVDSAVVKPLSRWGSMAVAEGADLAYLTKRSGEPDTDGAQRYEIGVIGHSADDGTLAHRVARQIRTWDREFRSSTAEFELHPLDTTPPVGDGPGRFVFDGPLNRIVVSFRHGRTRPGGLGS
jgi:protein-L-isoaspartate(D-aspartate) O-methyltransferase